MFLHFKCIVLYNEIYKDETFLLSQFSKSITHTVA